MSTKLDVNNTLQTSEFDVSCVNSDGVVHLDVLNSLGMKRQKNRMRVGGN